MSEAALCYPWLLPVRDRVLAQARQGRMHHALLLSGPQGIGKLALARCLAAARLCRAPTGAGACGGCVSCELLARQWALEAQTHPDYLELVPEKDGGQIAIESVREAIAFIHKTASVTDHKVVLIHPVEGLNAASANALLKILEEPTGDASLILVGQAVHRLPATVRSRCQQLALGVPAPAAALAWLQQQSPDTPERLQQWLTVCAGAPLRALACGEEYLRVAEAVRADMQALAERKSDPLAVSARWLKQDVAVCLHAFWQLLLERQRQAVLAEAGGRQAQAAAESLADVMATLAVLDHPQAHPNVQLLLEKLLIACGSRLALE